MLAPLLLSLSFFYAAASQGDSAADVYRSVVTLRVCISDVISRLYTGVFTSAHMFAAAVTQCFQNAIAYGSVADRVLAESGRLLGVFLLPALCMCYNWVALMLARLLK